jgi:ubiquinone biosynthesis protein UbiJ
MKRKTVKQISLATTGTLVSAIQAAIDKLDARLSKLEKS